MKTLGIVATEERRNVLTAHNVNWVVGEELELCVDDKDFNKAKTVLRNALCD